MPSIKIHAFTGMSPRSNRALQKGNEATYAQNVDFEHGTLKGLREPLLVAPNGAPNQTIYLTEAGWLRFPGVVDVAAGLPGCLRVAVTGDGFQYPSWETVDQAVAGNWLRLGLPIPEPVTASGGTATFSVSQSGVAPAPRVTTSGSTTTTSGGSWANNGGSWGGSSVTINGASFDVTLGISPVEWRSYIITYVDSFGNEGAASIPCERFAVDDGSAVTVNLPATPLGWDIAAIRIYRAGSGAEENDKEITLDEYLLVDEVAPGTISYPDSLANLDIDAEPCVSWEFTPPPSALKHIVYEPNGTQLAGAFGREVWFCEPHEFHAWPEKYKLTLDDDVVGLCWTETGLYAMTNGSPYWISAKADEFGYRDVHRNSETLPCASKRSICATPDGGVSYVHKDGVVFMAGKGSAAMMTLGLWSESDFNDLSPNEFMSAIWNGVWYGFTNNDGWMFEWKNRVHQTQYQPTQHLSARPSALHKSLDDVLYLALDNGICQWAAGDKIMDWVWRGRLTVTAGQSNMAGYKCVFERYPHEYKPSPYPVELKVITDDRILYKRKTDHSRPSRLPHGYRNLGFEIEISSDNKEPYAEPVEIREFHMASSMSDLSLNGAAN